jgi:hypothetical protein
MTSGYMDNGVCLWVGIRSVASIEIALDASIVFTECTCCRVQGQTILLVLLPDMSAASEPKDARSLLGKCRRIVAYWMIKCVWNTSPSMSFGTLTISVSLFEAGKWCKNATNALSIAWTCSLQTPCFPVIVRTRPKRRAASMRWQKDEKTISSSMNALVSKSFLECNVDMTIPFS